MTRGFNDLWKLAKGRVFDGFWKAVGQATATPDPAAEEAARQRATCAAPVVWLLGKTGSGKTSIIAALTEDPRAEIGRGFKPCTPHSFIYDWPSEAPVLRFLDTRGLGEAEYDPAPDIAYAEGHGHVLLVTMKAKDPAQNEVLSVVEDVRQRHPDWPVIVAQTTLHALYPRGAKHPAEYRYSGTDADDPNPIVPPELRTALQYQRGLLRKLKGSAPIWVPLDFTQPEDSYEPTAFGLEALKNALYAAGIEVLRQRDEAQTGAGMDDIARKAHPLILGYAATAGALGAVPIPVVGTAGLAPTIGLMLRALANRYGIEWTWRRLSEFAAAIGAGPLVGFGLRYGISELMKLIPVAGELAGSTLNAAAASALVYALGRAACVYLGSLRRGQAVPLDEIHRAFRRALNEAFERSRGQGRPRRERRTA